MHLDGQLLLFDDVRYGVSPSVVVEGWDKRRREYNRNDNFPAEVGVDVSAIT